MFVVGQECILSVLQGMGSSRELLSTEQTEGKLPKAVCPSPAAPMLGTVQNIVILCTICALGAALAAFLFVETANTEYSLAEAAFRGAFTSVMSNFAVFMTGQLRAIRGVADGLSTHGTIPDYATFNRVSDRCGERIASAPRHCSGIVS